MHSNRDNTPDKGKINKRKLKPTEKPRKKLLRYKRLVNVR